MSVAYAPSRFALDFLRARDMSGADPRYAGFTPAQWACFLLLGFGTLVLWKAWARPWPPALADTPKL
jgi:phosphatidylglycerol:prolipoprotein diacylglycerol transferase